MRFCLAVDRVDREELALSGNFVLVWGGGKLKYEFHLKPGSSVEDVRLRYRGAEGLKVGTGDSFWCGRLLGF